MCHEKCTLHTAHLAKWTPTEISEYEYGIMMIPEQCCGFRKKPKGISIATIRYPFGVFNEYWQFRPQKIMSDEVIH